MGCLLLLLQVFGAYEAEAAEDEAVQKKRKLLLEHSLLWRICEVRCFRLF
jgi:hypothetical protein